jgi:hypothetical protein
VSPLLQGTGRQGAEEAVPVCSRVRVGSSGPHRTGTAGGQGRVGRGSGDRPHTRVTRCQTLCSPGALTVTSPLPVSTEEVEAGKGQ